MTHLVFVLDTPNLWRGRALAGTPARSLALARHLAASGVAVTLVLCDRGADYGPSEDWSVNTLLVHPEVFYDRERLSATLKALACSAVICCEAEFLLTTAHHAAIAAGAHLIYDVHDDDAAVAASLGEEPSTVAQHRRVQRAALRAADGIVVSTRGEHQLARSAGVAERRITLAPNGADPERSCPRGPWLASQLLVFVGNLFYAPNARALVAIRDQVLPPLRGSDPRIQVRVVGQGPASLLRSEPGLEFLGRVPSVSDALSGAALGLAPLTAGSGAKMKVLDYLVAGIPVVGTSEAVTGLPATHPGVLVCDDIDAYPALIAGLLANPDRVRELAFDGVRCVEEDLSWPVIARRLMSALDRSHAHQRVRGSPRPRVSPGVARWRSEHERHGVLGHPRYTSPDKTVWLRLERVGTPR